MKDISIYFTPVNYKAKPDATNLGNQVEIHTEGNFPDLNQKGVAILHVPEYRNYDATMSEKASESFRRFFYTYYKGADWDFAIYDLGDVNPGNNIEDTYFALRQIVGELVKKSIIPVIIGGTQDLTYAVYQGYEALEQLINVATIDAKLDLGDPEEPLSKDAFVSKMLTHRPCFLFNMAVLGYQTPLVPQSELDLFEKLYFDAVRLGELKSDMKIAEPHLRNTDFLSIDLQSIKAAEFQGAFYQEPNGFENQEICQLLKYAGIADKMTTLGVFNYFPSSSSDAAHAQVAQMIWYFMDGYAQRVGDFPFGSKKEYTKFTVFLDEINHEIIFYRSNKSERWWMEVPHPPKEGVKFERHQLVPCDKAHYNNALKNEIPNLWWKTYQKLG